MHSLRLFPMFLDIEVVGIVAQALTKTGIDPASVPSAAQDEPLAASFAANADFHPISHFPHPVLSFGLYTHYGRMRSILILSSRVTARSGERALARRIFSKPLYHKYAMSGTISTIQDVLKTSRI